MKTNIFLNSYSQPENKLTFNFLALIELLNDSVFCSFLTGLDLADKPVVAMNLVYGGGKSNPDGSFQLKRKDGKLITVYFENKTYRRGVDIEQLHGHLGYCGEDDILLLITPRPTDASIVKSVNKPQIRFKTWAEVSSYLKKYDSAIAKQFVEYGKIRGEFESLGELHREEIDLYCKSFKINFDGKIDRIFQELSQQIDLSTFGFDASDKKNQNSWGRNSIEINLNKPYGSYGQWYSIAYYYDTWDHGIPFKNDVPEIAVFFDIEPSGKKLLKNDTGFKELLIKLEEAGFESNLQNELGNSWRLFFYRKPISEFEELNAHQILLFIEEVFGKLIATGCMEHRYFKELSRSSAEILSA